MDKGYGIALRQSGWFTQMPAIQGTEATLSNMDAILHMVSGSPKKGWKVLHGVNCEQSGKC